MCEALLVWLTVDGSSAGVRHYSVCGRTLAIDYSPEIQSVCLSDYPGRFFPSTQEAILTRRSYLFTHKVYQIESAWPKESFKDFPKRPKLLLTRSISSASTVVSERTGNLQTFLSSLRKNHLFVLQSSLFIEWLDPSLNVSALPLTYSSPGSHQHLLHSLLVSVQTPLTFKGTSQLGRRAACGEG